MTNISSTVESLQGVVVRPELITVNYFIFGVLVVAVGVFHWIKWNWIAEALSENGKASSKRLGGYFLIIVVGINEMYTTLRTQEFKDNHLYAILIMILMCWGLATSAQLIGVWKSPGETKSKE